MTIFPNDADLQVSLDEIKACQFKFTQLEKQLIVVDGKKSDVVHTFQEMKRKLTTATQGLNVAFTLDAYQEAKYAQRQYEKAVSELERMYANYRHAQQNRETAELRLTELIEEVDELKGEQNILVDRKTRSEQHITEIEKQLQIHGMEEDREQIQQVQQEMNATKKELDETRRIIPQKDADKSVVLREITTQEQKLRFSEVMIEA